MRYILLVINILMIYSCKVLADTPVVRYSTLLGAFCGTGSPEADFCSIVADVDADGGLYFIAEYSITGNASSTGGGETVHRLMRIHRDGTGVEEIYDIAGPCHIRKLLCHDNGCIYIEYGSPEAFIFLKLSPSGQEQGRIMLPFSPSCSHVDTGGNIFIAGSILHERAGDIPVTDNAMFGAFIGGQGDKDMYIMRYGPECDLRYCSFLGGPGLDYPVSITSDSRRNIILSCYSLSNEFTYLKGGEFPSSAVLVFNFLLNCLVYGWRSSSGSDYFPSGYDTSYDPGTDSIFDVGDRHSVFRFSAEGEFQWVYQVKEGPEVRKNSGITSDSQLGRGISIGESGCVYYSMDTGDASFPVTDDALDPDFNGGEYDLTISRIGSGGVLEYATYYGGSGTDRTARKATAYRNGVYYCVGVTDSPDFPTTPGAFMVQSPGGGCSLFAFAVDFQATACPVETDQTGTAPESFSLEPPHPNPFNPSVTLSFTLPETGSAEVGIYNIAGQLVRALQAGWLPAGKHSVVWDGCTSSGETAGSGVYFARLNSGARSAVRRITLVR